ncbi:MAG TPA: BON domain-containing protein [Gammaproteobacteria bacterium]|nr:BON domain-containing protein [Gammaproteobacteria bacterium]
MKSFNTIVRCYLVLMMILVLHGCAAAVVGTGATGVAVAHDRRTTGTVIEDQAIELKAIQAFYSDQQINAEAHINVTSYNTVVLVTGEAPTEELRDRIISIVRDIPKVSHVYNEITIAAPSSFVSRSSDSLITSKVKTRLLTLKDFDGTRVKVVTEKGVVYLMGLVTREEGDRATETARKAGGVQKVVKLFQYLD